MTQITLFISHLKNFLDKYGKIQLSVRDLIVKKPL